MKKLLLLFFVITTLSFAIPDFEKLSWGFTSDAIEGFYPNLKSEFTTSVGVTKYTYIPTEEDTNLKKITFYLYQNKLYKIIVEYDPSKIDHDTVGEIYGDFTERWGEAEPGVIDEKYDDFSIKGNKQTWVTGGTYISLIGQDHLDAEGNLVDSKLLVEYGLIDPGKRNNNSSLNKLILED
jgi:hypothetical protein